MNTYTVSFAPLANGRPSHRPIMVTAPRATAASIAATHATGHAAHRTVPATLHAHAALIAAGGRPLVAAVPVTALARNDDAWLAAWRPFLRGRDEAHEAATGECPDGVQRSACRVAGCGPAVGLTLARML